MFQAKPPLVGPGAALYPKSESTWFGARPGAQYVEVNRRLSSINGFGATVITGLTIASIWGHWRALAVVAAIQGAVIAFNLWVNLVYLPKRGRRAEIVRTSVNVTTGLVVNYVAGWPAPVWLWLPFVALAFDHLDGRVAISALATLCLVQDSVALYDGVPWIYPLSFTAFAAFASVVSRVRFAAMRDMLTCSNRQRAEIARTHISLRKAHARLQAEIRAREEAERELRQAQKLEAVGRLAAGVAHEINTPVQFVNDSILFLRDAAGSVFRLMEKLQSLQESVLTGQPSIETAEDAQRAAEEEDVEYIRKRVPRAFERALEGLERVASIVRSMKEFAHPDHKEKTLVDLNRAIEATLVIARNEYKYVADVETDLGDLPPVLCHGGDVNQVILNVIVNAAHAIGDAVKGTGERGRISVRTRREGSDVVLAIRDTGAGIPQKIREHIFDPFFTTKEVGKGTGQGLAIARTVIVDKHGGQLSFESEPGSGTTFYIRLPVDGSVARMCDDAAA